jgi:hypothetical protein
MWQAFPVRQKEILRSHRKKKVATRLLLALHVSPE